VSRHFPDWLNAFVTYSDHMESPKIMRFFAGVSAIAGALRKKIWLDEHYFKWTPNFYIIFVAPPGIVSKSTTADVAMELLRQIPGIRFGPDVVTWQALVTTFAACSEAFEYNGDWHPMSPMTLVSSELGNLVNPRDREMVNLLIDLWDGRNKLEKHTKLSGNDIIEAPWINLIACTTPNWIADNVPASMVGGGFTSRCIFIYCDTKEKFIARPGRHVPKDIMATRSKLIQDLEHISLNICGEFHLSDEALEWEEKWYKNMWNAGTSIYDDQANGYRARKQTHVNKLAMVLSASRKDTLTITIEDFQLAERMITNLEADMPRVFSKIGQTETSVQAERFIEFVRKKGTITYEDAYAMIHSHFPDFRDFEGILSGAVRSGQIVMSVTPLGMTLSVPKGSITIDTLIG
jgi:hypothetical protein